MGRKKQTKVDKTPFKLRRRRLADGRESLFIDYTAGGKHEYEFLSLYLVPETSVKAKRENAKTLRQAEEIILAKTEVLVNEQAQVEAAKAVLTSFRPNARLCDIDKKFCTDYADWLKGGYLTKDGKAIEKATAFSYFWQLGIALTCACQKEYIRNRFPFLYQPKLCDGCRNEATHTLRYSLCQNQRQFVGMLKNGQNKPGLTTTFASTPHGIPTARCL